MASILVMLILYISLSGSEAVTSNGINKIYQPVKGVKDCPFSLLSGLPSPLLRGDG
jgi:hypothetical protein